MGQPSFEQNTMQIQKAYVQQQEPCENLFEGIEVDALDRLYIQTRTVMDSWVIWALIVVGILTLLPSILKKFGISIKSPFTRSKLDD